MFQKERRNSSYVAGSNKSTLPRVNFSFRRLTRYYYPSSCWNIFSIFSSGSWNKFRACPERSVGMTGQGGFFFMIGFSNCEPRCATIVSHTPECEHPTKSGRHIRGVSNPATQDSIFIFSWIATTRLQWYSRWDFLRSCAIREVKMNNLKANHLTKNCIRLKGW